MAASGPSAPAPLRVALSTPGRVQAGQKHPEHEEDNILGSVSCVEGNNEQAIFAVIYLQTRSCNSLLVFRFLFFFMFLFFTLPFFPQSVMLYVMHGTQFHLKKQYKFYLKIT